MAPTATSATGNSRRRDAGFSLVEALVALVILALMGGVVLVLAPGPERRASAFVERFAALMGRAGEEAIVENRAIGLVLRDGGYGFARLEPEGWRLIAGGPPLGFQAFPRDIEVRLETPDDRPSTEDEIAPVVRFDALGEASPAAFIITSRAARWRVGVDGEGRARVDVLE